MWLLTDPGGQSHLQLLLPHATLNPEDEVWASLAVVIAALLLFPAVTILLAYHRTFGWPLLPLVLFFGSVLLRNHHTVHQTVQGLVPLTGGVMIFLLFAWVPFARTVVLTGARTFNDPSCGPRAFYLICRSLDLKVSLLQVRRLTKIDEARNTLAQHRAGRSIAWIGRCFRTAQARRRRWVSATRSGGCQLGVGAGKSCHRRA